MIKKNKNTRSLKFDSWISAIPMSYPFVFPVDRIFYNADGEKLMGTAVQVHITDKGGLFVFPLAAGYHPLKIESHPAARHLIDYSKYINKFHELIRRFVRENKFDRPNCNLNKIIFNTGHVFQGYYNDAISDSRFNYESFTIEIKGVYSERLLDLASILMKGYNLSVLMVRDLNTDKTFLADNPGNI